MSVVIFPDTGVWWGSQRRHIDWGGPFASGLRNAYIADAPGVPVDLTRNESTTLHGDYSFLNSADPGGFGAVGQWYFDTATYYALPNYQIRPTQYSYIVIAKVDFSGTYALLGFANTGNWYSGLKTSGSDLLLYHDGGQLTATGAITMGWQIYAGTYDGNVSTLYVDGFARASSTFNSITYNWGDQNALGGNPFAGSTSFLGRIAAFYLWLGRCLTADEVLAFQVNPWVLLDEAETRQYLYRAPSSASSPAATKFRTLLGVGQ